MMELETTSQITTDEKLQDIRDQLNRVESRQEEIAKKLKQSSKFNFNEVENEERGNWTGRLDFILSCIGFAVGLGNVWRFPYLCYRNGGGAFFIPYFLFLFIVGIPLFLVELSLGQFTSQGCVTCWDFAPVFKGIGVGMVLLAALLSIYYQVIISWAWWYLFDSFRTVLPWTTCGPWSSMLCKTRLHNITLAGCNNDPSLTAFPNGTCWNTTTKILYGIYNETLAKKYNISTVTPAADYLKNVSLRVSQADGLNNIGPVRWDLALCLLLAWMLTYFALIKGIRTSGKVVYFTAIFPYVVLIILFVNALFQDGYKDGIEFYIKPNITRLAEADVWRDAAVQIFFSLSLCYGGMVVYASFNRFHTNVVRDTLVVCLGNCCTSVFAGFVVFSYLGAFAKTNGVPVKDVVESGVSLAFIVYPQAVTTLPVPTLWSVLFFMMLITLGMDSEMALTETVVTGFVDGFKRLRPYRGLVLFFTCAVLYLLGLALATNGGTYVLQLMDDYSGGWNVLMVALLECIALWCYGHFRFARDIETMIGRKAIFFIPWRWLQYWFILCWAILAPILLVFVIIFSLVKYKGSSNGSYIFPTWANAIGWIITFIFFLSVFFTMGLTFCLLPGKFSQKLRNGFKPTRFWGPALPKHRKLVTYVDGFEVDPHDISPPDTFKSPYNAYEVPMSFRNPDVQLTGVKQQ